MWDATTGGKLYMFEGHDAPVFSICPHHKENIQVTILICHLIFFYIDILLHDAINLY